MPREKKQNHEPKQVRWIETKKHERRVYEQLKGFIPDAGFKKQSHGIPSNGSVLTDTGLALIRRICNDYMIPDNVHIDCEFGPHSGISCAERVIRACYLGLFKSDPKTETPLEVTIQHVSRSVFSPESVDE